MFFAIDAVLGRHDADRSVAIRRYNVVQRSLVFTTQMIHMRHSDQPTETVLCAVCQLSRPPEK